MKTMIFAVLAALFVAFVVPMQADAQVIRIDKPILGSYAVTNSTADSLLTLKVKVVDPTLPRAAHLELTDAIPDSVRISWYTRTSNDTIAVNDSIKVQLALQGHQVGAPLVSAVIDTIAAHGSDYVTITGSTLASYDEFGIRLYGLTGNAVLTVRRPRLFMRAEFFFHE